MQNENSDLHNWYLAYLRKNAQEVSKARELTPRKLIRADDELLKQIIEKEASNVRAIPQSNSNEKVLYYYCTGFSFVAFAFGFIRLHWEPLTSMFLMFAAAIGIILSVRPQYLETQLSKDLKSIFDFHGFKVSGVDREAKQNKDAYVKQGVLELFEQLEIMRQKESLIFDYCPSLLCKLNAEGIIIDLNENAQKILDYGKGELVGLPLCDLLTSPSKQMLMDSLARCQTSADAEQAEIIVNTKEGEKRDLLWRSEWSKTSESYFCIAEDISSRKENERLRKELTAMVTHDLKTPLTGLIFWADNMLTGIHGELSEKTERAVRRALRNLKGLLFLMDNLLDLEKLELGKVKVVNDRFPLKNSFSKISETFAEWLQNEQLSLEIAETDLVVNCDVQLLNRLLSNFVSNAIKWSPKGSSIWLRARLDREFVVIEIEDSGPGLPAEMKESLFQRWSSFAPPSQKGFAGSGLGLYIARKFAEIQGGSTGMRVSERGGSIFWVSLPVASES